MLEFFSNCETLEAVKKRYRELCKQYHPDLHGANCEEIMKRINAEYETVYNRVRSGESAEKSDNMSARDFADIINSVILFEGVEIDIVGCWIWLSGNTYQWKDKISALGFRWSKSRKKWYYAGELGGVYFKNKKKLSYGDICRMYGCETLTGKNTSVVAM